MPFQRSSASSSSVGCTGWPQPVPVPPPAPPQPAYATPAAAAPGDAIAIPAMGGALTSTHVCMITVAAQLLVVFAIQPNGEKGGNHVSVPVWAAVRD